MHDASSGPRRGSGARAPTVTPAVAALRGYYGLDDGAGERSPRGVATLARTQSGGDLPSFSSGVGAIDSDLRRSSSLAASGSGVGGGVGGGGVGDGREKKKFAMREPGSSLGGRRQEGGFQGRDRALMSPPRVATASGAAIVPGANVASGGAGGGFLGKLKSAAAAAAAGGCGGGGGGRGGVGGASRPPHPGQSIAKRAGGRGGKGKGD